MRHNKSGIKLDPTRMGVMVLSTIVDDESVFQLRFIYVYGLAADGEHRIPDYYVTPTDFQRICQDCQIAEGETRFTASRLRLFSHEEPSPILQLPALYVGRYYYAPLPNEKVEVANLTSVLEGHKMLWDLRPIYEAADEQEGDNTNLAQEGEVLIHEEKANSNNNRIDEDDIIL
jgi:hypothetical protein